jgi:hypothetical protein
MMLPTLRLVQLGRVVHRFPLLFLIFLVALTKISGQDSIPRRDSILLSMYNNGQKFRLTPAAFGQKIIAQDLTGDLILAYDTIRQATTEIVAVTNTTVQIDSFQMPMFGTNEPPPTTTVNTQYAVLRRCDTLTTRNLKDKILLLYFNAGCDPTHVQHH